MDTVDQATRSRMMSAVRPKDTGPELMLRKGLHAAGLRFRVHSHAIKGRPDIVLRAYRTLIFINGCFWHRHDCRKGKSVPASNVDFWRAKFAATVRRDAETRVALTAEGWKIIVVWECEISSRRIASVAAKIRRSKRFDLAGRNRQDSKRSRFPLKPKR